MGTPWDPMPPSQQGAILPERLGPTKCSHHIKYITWTLKNTYSIFRIDQSLAINVLLSWDFTIHHLPQPKNTCFLSYISLKFVRHFDHLFRPMRDFEKKIKVHLPTFYLKWSMEVYRCFCNKFQSTEGANLLWSYQKPTRGPS